MNVTLCKYQYSSDALALNGNTVYQSFWIQEDLCLQQLEAVWTVNLWQLLIKY